MPPTSEKPEFIALGHITRPHGVHGAVIIAPYTDNAALILSGRNLKLVSPEGKIKSAPGLKGKEAAQGLIVKIKGISTRDEARKLAGWTIGLERNDLPPLPDDEIYWADLLGLEVYVEDKNIGRVEKLMEAGAGLLLAVVSPGDGKERLIPFNEEFAVSVEPDKGRLTLALPPGLLEL
jgi:16S rRNA processing protein RimM